MLMSPSCSLIFVKIVRSKDILVKMHVAYVLRRYLLSVEPNVEDISPIFTDINALVDYVERYVFQEVTPDLKIKLDQARTEKNVDQYTFVDKLSDRVWIERLHIFANMQDWEDSE